MKLKWLNLNEDETYNLKNDDYKEAKPAEIKVKEVEKPAEEKPAEAPAKKRGRKKVSK